MVFVGRGKDRPFPFFQYPFSFGDSPLFVDGASLDLLFLDAHIEIIKWKKGKKKAIIFSMSEEKVPFKPLPPKYRPNKGSRFNHTIAIISGKGGVGKSLVSALLAAQLEKNGKTVALLDADVTGPSAAKAFGVEHIQAMGDEENNIYPPKTKGGMAVMSSNNLLDDITQPLVWRGPMIAGLVSQMYSDVVYGEVDYLLIDMPPGTGDVPLTVFQSIKVDGVIVVASPQDLVKDVVEKSIKMAETMEVKILGIVVNMAYAICPHCSEKLYLYGETRGEELAKELGVDFLDEIPIDSSLRWLVDKGQLEAYEGDYLSRSLKAVENL